MKTVSEICVMFGVTKVAVYNWIKAGKVKPVIIGKTKLIKN
jgi:predicted site-specific integrase-resolvase